MELVELVVQGIVGAPETVRVPFNPTVTVLPSTSRERVYVRIVLDLLYPKGTELTLADLPLPGAQSRVALTVIGRDQQRYRLLQDVQTGRRALQRMAGDKAETVTSASNEIAQAVTATIGFPTEDILRELIFCVREDLPSQKTTTTSSASKSKSAGKKSGKNEPKIEKPLPPGFSDEGAPVVDRGNRSDEELRARLAQIDAELKAQESIKDVEFEIDGLQKKSFEIDAKLKPLAQLRRNLDQCEQAMTRFHSIQNVPADLPEKAERLKKSQDEHRKDLERFDLERDKLVESSGAIDRRGRINPVDVAQKDPFVRYGIAAGVGAIALGLVGAVAYAPLQWIAFLDIPAFGVALFGGIRVLGSLEHGVSVKRRIERLTQEQKKLDDRLKVEEEHLKSVLARAGFAIEQLADVEEQLKARAELEVRLESARAALAEAEKGGDVATLEKQQAEISVRVKELEEKLQGQGGYGLGDLQAERAEIVAILSGEAAAKPEPEPVAAPFDDDDNDNGADDVEDACKRQLELARDVLMAATIEDVANQVKARASQILGALADGRFSELRFGGRGEASVVDAAAGKPIAFGALPPFDRDLAYLAVKVALVEMIVKRERLPAVFDRGLDAIADQKGPLLQKMLQFLASMTQVVCMSEKASLGGRPA